jgi:hypothetical protein
MKKWQSHAYGLDAANPPSLIQAYRYVDAGNRWLSNLEAAASACWPSFAARNATTRR